jgi:deazaflavin-dependent oxidoreductase (nitroreductase family)
MVAMMRVVDRSGPPQGLRRWLLRLPVVAFRSRLGWLFGGRLVLVEHVGRRSGARHSVVVEVVARDPATGTVTVASGFGAGADWYRNLITHPETTIRIGPRRIAVTAQTLPADQGASIMVDYAHRHPRAAPRVARFMGYDVDGSDDDYAALGRSVPFLALVPTDQR